MIAQLHEATISMTMRPLRLKCFSCISTWAEKHSNKKHYPKRKHGRQSMFFKKSISPEGLFDKVSDVLRSEIKASENKALVTSTV